MLAHLDRRSFLWFGSVALAQFPLASTEAARGTSKGRARACILLYMDGGPSHIDLWDLKPSAPVEVRGPFQPISTSVAGITVCEHLPRTARQMHRLAQVRSVRHTETIHDPAVYQMLTGRKHPISAGGLTVGPDDFPQMGSAFGSVDRRPAVMPAIIEMPETMRMEARVLPGQSGGFLGPAYDPFRVEVSREAQVIPPDFERRADISEGRMANRANLLAEVAGHQPNLAKNPRSLANYQRQALDLLARPAMRSAFDLQRESGTLRERYGLHRHGQSALLARRLVEAGSRFVTVYWGREDQDWADGRGLRPANNPWDTHRNHFPLLKDSLLPRADQTLAALLADLADRGMLDSTLVVWMGDFGRTPRIDRRWASRDHWPHANTVLFAGAGVPGGAVIGRTDGLAAQVTDNPVSPADLTATIFHLLGVAPRSTLPDPRGRQIPLSEGRPIRKLVS